MSSTNQPFFRTPMLTPEQQQQLYAAISGRQLPLASQPYNALDDSSYNLFPTLPTSTTLAYGNLSSFQNSPDLDSGNFPDTSIDVSHSDANVMATSVRSSRSSSRSASGEAESAEKRRHTDDDDDESGNDAKRREKSKKPGKPGRKPITTEPTNRRKAQNRAAQRAFRERKQKHLEDLETQVATLEEKLKKEQTEKQSVSYELERSVSEVQRLRLELNEYKKTAGGFNTRPSDRAIFGAPLTSNINDVNFQFNFPKFGAYGSTQSTGMASTPSSQNRQSLVSQSRSSGRSPFGLDSNVSEDDFATSPETLLPGTTTALLQATNSSRHNSSDSHFSPAGPASSASPSSSSHSNMGGPSSSCGTSPEAFPQSPLSYKPIDTLTIIGEEQSGYNPTSDLDQSKTGAFGFPDNFDFDFQGPLGGLGDLDTINFGNYRDPSANFMMGDTTFDSNLFFDDDYSNLFAVPENIGKAPETAGKLEGAPKKSLIAEIDAAKEADEADPNNTELNCDSIWAKLSTCEKAKNADFDLDGLCKDLQKKAKCSGRGDNTTVVDQKVFKEVMKKYLGDDFSKKCEENMDKAG